MPKDDDSLTEQDTEDDTEATQPMSDKDRQKRIAELKAELEELDGEGQIEGATDADLEQVAEDIEDAAEDIASEVEDPQDVESAASDEAEAIADELSGSGITLTEKQIEGLADRIARKVVELSKGDKKDDKPAKDRTPDKRPKSQHFSERQIFGRKRKD